jgi:molybdate transport system ATP-binding protein
MLKIDVQKELGDLSLDIQADIPLQGVCAIFGRSGAGKTSLVNMLGGLSHPDSGDIHLGEKTLFSRVDSRGLRVNLPPEKRNIGYVFQEARLFPHYTVRGNLNYGKKDYGKKDYGNKDQSNKDQSNTRSADDHFNQIVNLLGIEHLLGRYPKSLSGGEKQRVAIGRALLTSPSMLLMDEPLASLDLPRKRELIPYLQSLASQLSIPIVYVSHSLDEILQLADHMLVLSSGKVVAQGPLAQVWNSDEMRPWVSAQELSSLLHAKVVARHPKYPMTQLMLKDGNRLWVSGLLDDSPKERLLKVRVEANHVSLCTSIPENSSIRNVLSGTVKELHSNDTGEQVQVKIQLGDDELWANVTTWACDDLGLMCGTQVYAQIKGVSMGATDLAQSH